MQRVFSVLAMTLGATAMLELQHCRPAPGALAHLSVTSSPWGRLAIDDSIIGNTPQADVALTPGTHAIRVARDGFVSYETSITIRAGETLRLTDIVLKNPQDAP
jgi:PEGA domain-containing protein